MQWEEGKKREIWEGKERIRAKEMAGEEPRGDVQKRTGAEMKGDGGKEWKWEERQGEYERGGKLESVERRSWGKAEWGIIDRKFREREEGRKWKGGKNGEQQRSSIAH